MRPFSKILLLPVLLTALGTLSSPATAKSSGFCLECHSSNYLRSFENSPLIWDGDVFHARLEPCPGIRSLAEENFFTESRIVKLGEILTGLDQEGWATESLRKRIGQTAESFSRLRGGGIPSVGQFTRESSTLRSALQKVYDRTLKARAEWNHRWLIGVGAVALLIVLILLGIGLQKLTRMGKALLLILLLGEGLSLGACSSSPVEPARKSPAKEQVEVALSVADQDSRRVEEGFYRAILLAQAARRWSRIDPAGAEQAFQLAWRMALRTREEAGRIRSLDKVISRWPSREEANKEKVDYDSVLDLRDEIENVGGRAWPFRAIAEEWVQAQEKKGRSALESASQMALEVMGPERRDRDLSSIVEAWALVDGERAWDISRSITDPFLKSWTLANLALSVRTQDRADNIIREAWKTAESISSVYAQGRAFARISAAGARILPQEKKFWQDEVTARVQRIKDRDLRIAVLRDVILEWSTVDGEQSEKWTEDLPPEFSEGRAYSFLLLSQRPGIPPAQAISLLKKAVVETERVADPFQSQRIKALGGKGMAKLSQEGALEILSQVAGPFYRSEILGQLADQLSPKDPRKALEMAERIPLQPLREKMVVKIIGRGMAAELEKVDSLYMESLQAARSIPDPYSRALTLIELGNDWGSLEEGREVYPFESALKAAGEISSPSLSGDVLETLASAWKNFDPGEGESVRKGIDPSVLTVRKSLEEIRLWAQAEPMRAKQWADAIPTSFPYEKALAFKEVAGKLKKSQPQAASEIFGMALEQSLAVQEGAKRTRLLSEILSEVASLDKDWMYRRLSLLPRWTRDALFKEAGITWSKEDPLKALIAAREISESSLRLTLYQKSAEIAAQRADRVKSERNTPPSLSALVSLGRAEEKAKREGLKAIPLLEEALGKTEKITDPREKSFLLGALAAQWAPLDEKKALQVAGKIPADEFSEPYSYALLGVGTQYSKWSRREAEAVFQKVLIATDKLSDPSLRAKRLLQLAEQWGGIDPEKGKEALLKAEKAAQSIPPGRGDPLMAQILQLRVAWDPENSVAICRNGTPPSMRAKLLLQGAKLLRGRSLDGNVKALEKALQSAKSEKNFRLMSEVAMAWYPLSLKKSQEILRQVETKEFRVGALLQMAKPNGFKPGQGAKFLIGQATREALAIDDLTQKMQLLKEVAGDWERIDKERAKETFLSVYHAAEKEYLTSPHF